MKLHIVFFGVFALSALFPASNEGVRISTLLNAAKKGLPPRIGRPTTFVQGLQRPQDIVQRPIFNEPFHQTNYLQLAQHPNPFRLPPPPPPPPPNVDEVIKKASTNEEYNRRYHEWTCALFNSGNMQFAVMSADYGLLDHAEELRRELPNGLFYGGKNDAGFKIYPKDKSEIVDYFASTRFKEQHSEPHLLGPGGKNVKKLVDNFLEKYGREPIVINIYSYNFFCQKCARLIKDVAEAHPGIRFNLGYTAAWWPYGETKEYMANSYNILKGGNNIFFTGLNEKNIQNGHNGLPRCQRNKIKVGLPNLPENRKRSSLKSQIRRRVKLYWKN